MSDQTPSGTLSCDNTRAVSVTRGGRQWLCPAGAPQEHPWLVPADWDALICSVCVEDETCCECDNPDLISLIEHKARVWATRAALAPNTSDPVTVAEENDR